MSNTHDPYGFQDRKKKLNAHLAKFNRLRNEEKWLEAMQQFSTTLQYTGESLEYSVKILDQTLERMNRMSRGQQQRIRKIIH